MSDHFRKMALVSEDELQRLKLTHTSEETQPSAKSAVDAIHDLLQKKLNDETAHQKQDLRKKAMQDHNDVMQGLLKSQDLDDRTKSVLYQQALLKYLRVRNHQEEAASLISNPKPPGTPAPPILTPMRSAMANPFG